MVINSLSLKLRLILLTYAMSNMGNVPCPTKHQVNCRRIRELLISMYLNQIEFELSHTLWPNWIEIINLNANTKEIVTEHKLWKSCKLGEIGHSESF